MSIFSSKNSLIMISTDIQSHEQLKECVNDNVLVFLYNKSWSYENFMAELTGCLETAKIQENSLELVGWVFHGFNVDKPDPDVKARIIFNLVADHNIILNDKSNLTQYQHLVDFILFVKKYMKTDRFDLISCCLLGNPYFTHVHQLLTMTTDLKFASSDDITGNTSLGDWILESDDVNLIGTYFKPDTNEKLSNIAIELYFRNDSPCM